MTPTEEGQDVKSKKDNSGTHGSVLMEMIKSQDQQPKQLTVGAKGTLHVCCVCQCLCVV